MNATTNYQLNQWAKSDQVRMEDFNADNAKIDAALAALSSGKGNCQIATGTYTGSGTYGVNAPNSLTFPFKPQAVLISGDGGTAVLHAGSATCTLTVGTLSVQWSVTWSGNTMSWYTAQAKAFSGSYFNFNGYSQLNDSGQVYHYLAIGAADD